MARNLAVPLTVQERVNVPDGLGGSSYSWEDRATVTVTLTPASAHVVTQASLRGQAATHTAIVPRGVMQGAGPLTHRLITPDEPDSSSWTAYGINRADDLPRGTVLELEAQRVTTRQ